MRISYWSSSVCSSDLLVGRLVQSGERSGDMPGKGGGQQQQQTHAAQPDDNHGGGDGRGDSVQWYYQPFPVWWYGTDGGVRQRDVQARLGAAGQGDKGIVGKTQVQSRDDSTTRGG